MLIYAALGRDHKRRRVARIADISAGSHGGDGAKKLLQSLETHD